MALAILGVSRHRVAHRREMNADLVRAPCVEVAPKQCMRAPTLDDRVPRAREAPAGDHRHALALRRVPPDRAFQLARVVLDQAPHDRQVRTAQRPVAQLLRERPMSGVMPRDHDQSAGALVQAVHDPRASLAAHGRPAAPATKQRMHQRPGVVARRRMHDHAGGFVDHHQVVVLVDDLQRDQLASDLSHEGLGQFDVDHVALGYARCGLGRAVVEKDEVAFGEARRRSAAEVRQLLGHETVEPWRGCFRDQAALFGLRRKDPATGRTTPMLMAESARLNTGQKWMLTKSVTVPYITRSKPLPTVPPRIRPRIASVGRSPGWRITYTTRAIATTTEAIKKKTAPAGATPKAAPEFRTLVIPTRFPIACTSVP